LKIAPANVIVPALIYIRGIRKTEWLGWKPRRG
jgi:hypothetical protein